MKTKTKGKVKTKEFPLTLYVSAEDDSDPGDENLTAFREAKSLEADEIVGVYELKAVKRVNRVTNFESVV